MRSFLIVVLIGVSGALSACSSSHGGSHMGSMGGSNDTENAPTEPGAREIKVRGTSFRFDPRTINIAANEDVTIVLTSSDGEHDVTVEGISGVRHIVHAENGTTARGGINISSPGTYTIYCSVPGHRQAGMTGKLVVA